VAHGGNPAPPGALAIDGTGLTFFPIGSGNDTWVIPATDAFEVTMDFTLSGSLAGAFVSGSQSYAVTYTFSGLGGPTSTAAHANGTTIAGVLTYGTGDTTATVPAGTLSPGTYEVVATVSFAPAWPIVAFFEFPVLEIF
jgi:hypothetical protein